MSRRSREENMLLDYPGPHYGKPRKDVPCAYLLEIYTYNDDISDKLADWIEVNLEEITKAQDAGDDATLNSFYEI